MKRYYFDYAAATPLSPTVFKAMRPYFDDKFYNPSALYLAAQDVKKAVNQARADVAKILGAKPAEIIFTAGGTESDNLAVRGVMEQFPGANCVVSAVEHEAVLEPAKLYNHKLAPVRPDGRIDSEKLKGLIDDQTVMVSVMYANNEIGTVQPLREVARVIKSKVESRKSRGFDLPLFFHTDAAQATNYLPLTVSSLGVDLMSLNGGKIYGPKQCGILFVKTGTKLKPQTLGGGQEHGLRSGTENVPAVIGFAAALRETASLRDKEQARLRGLQRDFLASLTDKLPKTLVNGSLKHRLPNNLHMTFPGVDNERLMMELDEKGIMVATGSACSASSEEPSHILKAIGLSDDSARSSLRVSLGRQTDKNALDDLISALVEIVA